MSLHPKLQDAINRMRIVDVTLKAINASLSDNFDPEIARDEEDFSFQLLSPVCKSIKSYEGHDTDSGKRRRVFEMHAGLRILTPIEGGYRDGAQDPEKIEAHICATIECHFLVSYDESSAADEFLDDESLALFSSHNVPFNVWPYWRETVQSACGRMGLPRFVLPTHRLHKSATQK